MVLLACVCGSARFRSITVGAPGTTIGGLPVKIRQREGRLGLVVQVGRCFFFFNWCCCPRTQTPLPLTMSGIQTQRVSKEFLMWKMRSVQKHQCWKPLFWRRESKLGRRRSLLWIRLAGSASCDEVKAIRGWKFLLLSPRMIGWGGSSVPRSKLKARITSFQRGLCAERVHTQSVRRRRRQVPHDILEAIRLGRLTALQKPDGGV